MTLAADQIQNIRQALLDLPDLAAAKADRPPQADEIFAPEAHAGALDPDRPLVVGGRGVGKSFWASVLSDREVRMAAAGQYPRLELDRLDVALAFHEGAMGGRSVAPSPRQLAGLADLDPEDIWRAVLWRALAAEKHCDPPPYDFREAVTQAGKEPERIEDLFLEADEALSRDDRRFLLVFDALDRLAPGWTEINRLSTGAARLALDLTATRCLRVKLFMRWDQFDDRAALSFRDASKIINARVRLSWSKDELFGWLFSHLWRKTPPFRDLVCETLGAGAGDSIPPTLIHDEPAQRRVFARIAGPYMGADHRRGLTDRKIVNALADAFGETSLRSFSRALKTAAEESVRRRPEGKVLDHHCLNAGIVAASGVRVEELREDHPWITDVLGPLEGLTVPCQLDEFLDRWNRNGTVASLLDLDGREGEAPVRPLAGERLEDAKDLLRALERIGVLEERSDGRINVPDLFRVAAKMGRKGGVKAARRRD